MRKRTSLVFTMIFVLILVSGTDLGAGVQHVTPVPDDGGGSGGGVGRCYVEYLENVYNCEVNEGGDSSCVSEAERDYLSCVIFG